ncbi:MAG TPA: rhomboid family intramembrane serine protease [Candidatus Polarisedimenticolia bacterium]|nr:rhomboid family intramembrane serine protease [Candidatus Polarisedimenticolia bacterium]
MRLPDVSLRTVTPATSLIIGINVLVLACMAIATKGQALIGPSSQVLLRSGADWGPRTFTHEPWRAFTSMWVHAGVVHLFMNMWCLDTYGRVTERLFGWRLYLAIYTLAGLCGSIASLAWHPETVSVGASAAVFGVVGALLLPFKRGNLPIAPQALKAQGKRLFVFVGYNLLIGTAVPAIDNAAHVGGLLGGFTLGALGARDVRERRRVARGAVLMAGIVILAFFAVRHFRMAATLAQQAAEQLDAGHTDEAIVTATAAIAHDDRDAVGHVVLGAARLRKGEQQGAVEELEKAVRLEPDYDYALSQLGFAYIQLDRTADAVRVLERAVKLNEDDAVAWANLGVLHARTDRPDEALRALKTALEKNPRLAFAHDALGIVLQGRGELDPAIASFREALRLNPEDEEFRAHLADALDSKGLRQEAERIRRGEATSR